MNTSVDWQFRYPFEEFMDHVRAMNTVRSWQHTQRFGSLGASQDSRSHAARVLEYFCDSYSDSKEAIHKADLFLSIHDFIARNSAFLRKGGLVEQLQEGCLGVERALLRSVHFAFTSASRREPVDVKKVIKLARSFEDLEQPD